MTSDEIAEIIDDHHMFARFNDAGELELSYERERNGSQYQLTGANDRMVRQWLGRGQASISLIRNNVYYVTLGMG